MKKTTYHGYPVIFFMGDRYAFKAKLDLSEYGLGSSDDPIAGGVSEYYDIDTGEKIYIFGKSGDLVFDGDDGINRFIDKVGRGRVPAKVKK